MRDKNSHVYQKMGIICTPTAGAVFLFIPKFLNEILKVVLIEAHNSEIFHPTVKQCFFLYTYDEHDKKPQMYMLMSHNLFRQAMRKKYSHM